MLSGDLLKGPSGIMKEKPLCLRSTDGILPELSLDLFSSDHSVTVEEVLLVL